MKIKDIAKLAGVSPATVSRVMNNHGYVKQDKKEAVLKAIEAADYQPNTFAKSLKSQKSHMIGVIVPKISTETASRVVSGVTEIAKKAGYQVVIANTELSVEEEIKYLKFLSNRSVDGIVLMGTQITEKHLAVMDKLTIPVVVLGQIAKGYTSILYDDYEASYQVTDYLIKKGHKDIAFIGVHEQDRAVGKARKEGHITCLHDHGLAIDDGQIVAGDFEIATGERLMNEILNVKIPTAVFAVTDHLAIGAMHAIRSKGLVVPDDVSVVGIGDIKFSRYLNPPLTTIHYPLKRVGMKACEVVFDLIAKKRQKGEVLTSDFTFKVRTSVKDLTK